MTTMINLSYEYLDHESTLIEEFLPKWKELPMV